MAIITVTMLDGRRITGATALDVVREMNRRALIGEADAWRYMIALSKRVRRLRGTRVRTSSPEAFLFDMAAAGILHVERRVRPGRDQALALRVRRRLVGRLKRAGPGPGRPQLQR
jgi:hypothetical protein